MRKRTSTNKTKGSGYQIHFILNDEDYKLLIDNINIRGINQSDYFRELIHGTNQGKYYSIPVKNALDIITKGYIELRAHETEETKEIIDNIEEGVQLLWQFSR